MSEPFGSPRLNAGGLPSTRAQAEGLKVHPEPRFFTPTSKTVLRMVSMHFSIFKNSNLPGLII